MSAALRHAAERAAHEPAFLGNDLYRSASFEAADRERLAAHLNFDVGRFDELALCRTPRRDEHSHASIKVIAGLVGADPWRGYLAPAKAVSEEAQAVGATDVAIDDDETRDFVDRWFDVVAQARLAALAAAIGRQPPGLQAPLWCAFSRLIITKDRGASLARDVSHSRPHKVRDTTDFNPVTRFVGSAREVARRHATLGKARPTAKDLDPRERRPSRRSRASARG